MGLVLPDTNFLIYSSAGIDPYQHFMRQWIEKNQLVLSVIVIAEYLVKATPKEEKAFTALISATTILPVDVETAKQAAFFRKTSLKHKQKLHLPDCLIAAQCYLYKAILATLNPADYPYDLDKLSFPT